MNKDFKVGDKVRVVGHPFIKDDTRATIEINRVELNLADYCGIKVKSDRDDRDYLIDHKYLQKVEEDWLDFETTRDNDPLISTIDKLDKEVKLYNCMYQWKEKFDPNEADWENNEEDKWYISRHPDGDWHVTWTIIFKQNLRVYFTTRKKAEQCLEWLKKEGVLY